MKTNGPSPFYIFLLLFFLQGSSLLSINIQRIEPSHWWIGMKNPSLQILLHGKAIGQCKLSLPDGGSNWKLLKTETTSNPDYLFAELEISADAQPGNYTILAVNGREKKEIRYELRGKNTMAEGAKGYGPEDVLYLLMPDRFSNGDPRNDFTSGSLEKADRNNPSGRHGGDLQGVENHLDYLKNLGVTTLWLNPVLENNQPEYSYHGYAITDYYKVDARFGSLEDYKRLIRNCHRNGLKMVQDMVANHIGTEHYWMKSLPDTSWVHFSGKPFTRCNFRIETIADPNAASGDRTLMTDGWFDIHMADLNQQHPLLARYLIQNTLWWIAETGIDGIRMDTWPYNDKEFMSRWCEEIRAEFPQFSIVGEVWVDQPAFAAYFTKGALNQDGYRPTLPSCTDFPLYFALNKGLNEKGSWDAGLQRIYNALSQDFLYEDASANLIFADNHDLSRFITTQSGDFKKYQQGMAMLLTLRGVPQLYYGGEFALEGDGSQHSNVRLDFKGGWAGDKENFFEPKNLKGRADSAFHFLRSLLQWRKTSGAVAKGSFTQYLPEDNIYVYFRMLEGEAVMVAVNGNQEAKKLKTERFKELAKFSSSAKDVLENKASDLSGKLIEIPAQGVRILELKR